MYKQVITDLKNVATPEKAKASAWFFKTGKGQYGEGDIFIGVTVPEQRKIAKRYYKEITLSEIETLLEDPVHEYRLTALIMLVYKFEKEKEEMIRKNIFDFYLKNSRYVNNWDLVDSSAAQIVGGYLQGKDHKILDTLARSESVWDRRIAMIATYFEIQNGNPKETIQIAKMLLHDHQDLIQKAVGWMLREAGKRCSEKVLTDFLNTHYKTMPRTALRYAVERLTPSQKAYYMKK